MRRMSPFVLLLIAACTSGMPDPGSSEEPRVTGKADNAAADELLQQVLAIGCVQSAELEMTMWLDGSSEPTGRVIAVVSDAMETRACAEEIRNSDPALRIDEVFEDFGMVTVSRAAAPTRAEALAARVATFDCVASAEPERIVGVADAESGINDQTGRVLVTVRDEFDVEECANRVGDSEPEMVVEDVAPDLGIFLIGPKYELPSDAAFLAAELGAIECVEKAEPERIMNLDGSDGGETGRVLAIVRDGHDVQECADAIAASDPTLQIDDVLPVAGIVTVSRP